MIVVADTGPLNYLVLIDEIELLSALFGRVLIPQAAFAELMHSRTPPKVRQWLDRAPAWLEVRSVAFMVSPSLMRLGPGEREAIQLALELGINTILIDESEGRRAAEELRLEVRGTLGILERAAKLGKVDFRKALGKLDQTSFRVSPEVRAAFLSRNP
jgi:predicted nucleic acid-binding protein